MHAGHRIIIVIASSYLYITRGDAYSRGFQVSAARECCHRHDAPYDDDDGDECYLCRVRGGRIAATSDSGRGDHRKRGRAVGSARGPRAVGRVPVQERAGQAAARHVQVGYGVDARQQTRRQWRSHGGRRSGRRPGVRGHVRAARGRRPGGPVRVQGRPAVRDSHAVRGAGTRPAHYAGGQGVDGTAVPVRQEPGAATSVRDSGTRVGHAARSASAAVRCGRWRRRHRRRVPTLQETRSEHGPTASRVAGRRAAGVLGVPVCQVCPTVPGRQPHAGRSAARSDVGRQVPPPFGRSRRP